MRITLPTFDVAAAEFLDITDSEISDLLMQVYVEGGYTTLTEAVYLFDPAAVRGRGFLIGAREAKSRAFAGMVIVVPPDSPALRLGESGGAELHLLAVRRELRGHGLGRALVDAAVDRATHLGYSKISLLTQPSMHTAQKLYEAAGFVHRRDTERSGRAFKVYERLLFTVCGQDENS